MSKKNKPTDEVEANDPVAVQDEPTVQEPTPDDAQAIQPNAAQPVDDVRPPILRLTQNAAEHQVGETFTAAQAEASGIDEKYFQKVETSEGGVVTDRAIKQPPR